MISVDLTDNSEEIIKAKDDAIARALEAIGQQAEGYSKLLAPVDTGRLRNSITHDVETDEEAVYIGTNVDYAPYVEYGTRKTKAQPFIQPAVQDHSEEYKQMAEMYLKSE